MLKEHMFVFQEKKEDKVFGINTIWLLLLLLLHLLQQQQQQKQQQQQQQQQLLLLLLSTTYKQISEGASPYQCYAESVTPYNNNPQSRLLPMHSVDFG